MARVKKISRKYRNPHILKDNSKLRLGDMSSIIRAERRIERGEAKFYTLEEINLIIRSMERLYTEKTS